MTLQQLSHSLEIIIDDCGVERERIKLEEREEKKKDFLFEGEMILNELQELRKRKKKHQQQKHKIHVVYLTMEIKEKKKQLRLLINEMKEEIMKEEQERNIVEEYNTLIRKIEEEIQEHNSFKKNTSFRVSRLDEYYITSISNEITDGRIERIKENETEINKKLHHLEENVKRIKRTSQDIHMKLDNQEELLDFTKEKLLKNTERIKKQEHQLSKIIKQFSSPYNCCLTVLLLFCILGFLSIIAMILLSLFF